MELLLISSCKSKFLKSINFVNTSLRHIHKGCIIYSESRNGTVMDKDDKKLLRPMTEMPGPRPILPYFGTEWIYSKLGPYTQENMHHVAREGLYYRYGPIYKEHLGGATVVSLYKNEHIEVVFRNEGIHPFRQVNIANVYWRTKHKEKYSTVGLLDTVGNEWYELRELVSETLLKPDDGPNFTEILSTTADEFMEFLKLEMEQFGYIADIVPLLYRLGLEVMWRTIFRKKLGALQEYPPQEATYLIKHTADLIEVFADLALSKPLWKFCPAASPTFRKFSRTDSKLFDIVSSMTKPLFLELKDQETISKEFISKENFLLNKHFNQNFLTTMIVDFIAAGIPTTAYFMSMLLHRIGQERSLQARLQSVVDDVLSSNDTIITEDIYSDKLKLIKYTIKEGTRLTTPIPCISRILPVDIKIDNFFIPKNTPILCQTRVAAMLNRNFWRPLEFIPDRWMSRYPDESIYGPKELEIFKRDSKNGGFLVIPFGHGQRTCIGKALAERQVAIVLAKLLKNFTIISEGEIELGNLFLLAAVKPVPIWLQERNA